MNEKLNLQTAKLLAKILEGQPVYAREFNSKISKKWLNHLIAEGVLKKYHNGKTFYVISTTIESVRNYLISIGINDIYQYISLLQDKDVTRSQSVIAASDTKIKPAAVEKGFFLKVLQPLEITLNNKQFWFYPLSGTWYFVNQWDNLFIPRDIPVIGIENFETFARIEFYDSLPFIKSKSVFTYIGGYALKPLSWIKNIPNPYIHFGDFDLSSLVIFLSITKQRNNSHNQFFIPDNLEQLIRTHGNPNLYFKQLDDNRVKSVNFFANEQTAFVYELIKKYKRGLEQEVLEKI